MQINIFANYVMINIIFEIIILKINKFILLLDYSIKNININKRRISRKRGSLDG